jgi:hypothetical protein
MKQPHHRARQPQVRGVVPLALVFALAAAACGGGSSSTGTTTTPSVPVKTDTFNGTVTIHGSDSHTFSVSQTGEVDVTLTAAGPPSTIVMGLGVGTSDGSTCTLLAGASTNTQAGSAAQLMGKVSAGTLCVQVSDVGNQTETVTYAVTVAHP